MCRQKSLTKI